MGQSAISLCVCVDVFLVEENLCFLGIKPFGSGATFDVLPHSFARCQSQKGEGFYKELGKASLGMKFISVSICDTRVE